MPDQPQGLLAGRYRLVGQLGEGGMGRVWEARDELLGRDVAIKEISPAGLSGSELGDLRERAIREARAIAMVSHPNVVRIFDVVSHDGVPWIVMELIRSRSMLTVVNDEGPMDPQRAARIGLEILAALQAAHRAGILHRDVKPANVLLADDGRAVLTDFGLAAIAGDSTMTHTGIIVGSPSYLAPERALDEPARPSSDLWSLGATLFAAVEGRPPYAKSSPMATLASLMVDPAPAPKRAGVLRPALVAMLKKDSSERADADEAGKLLRDAANGVTPPTQPDVETSASPQAEPASRRRRVLLVTAAIAILVAIPLAIILTNRASHGTTAQAAQSDTIPRTAGLDPSGSPAARPAPSVKPSASGPPIKRPSRLPSNPVPATTQPSVAKAPPSVRPATQSLAAVFNNVGVTADTKTTAGNFDGGGATYSAQSLAAGGTTPGKALTVGGVRLTWPTTAGTGRKDNAIAAGQTIKVPGSGSRLAFLIAADYGAVSGNGRITYTDGTNQAYALASPDWFDTGDPAAAVVSTYQNRAGAARFNEPAAVFGATVTLTAGKTVASVRLPAVGAVPAREGTTTLHVFAARIG